MNGSQLQRIIFSRLFLMFGIAVGSFLIIFSRRPDAFLNPQFYAEDGAVWYAQAYQEGIYSLFKPELGYLGTISRLAAIIAQPIPLGYVPLLFNSCAVAVKITTVVFFLSSRFSKIVPRLSIRILLAFFYLALPNSFEIEANLTNAQWHLALLGFLIIVAAPSEKVFWKIFDALFLLLSVLSGPFCFFMFPVAIIRWLKTGDRQSLTALFIVVFGCAAQGSSMLLNERLPKAILGADFGLFTQIVSGQVFTGAIAGTKGYEWLIKHYWWNNFFAFVLCFGGIAFVAYAYRKVPAELKLFIVYAGLALTAALIFPAASRDQPQWAILAQPFSCVRYWFLPMMCFFTLLVYFASTAPTKIVKYSATAILALSTVGITLDWKHPAFRDYDFASHVAEFNQALSGAEVVIPINPQWQMKLIKK